MTAIQFYKGFFRVGLILCGLLFIDYSLPRRIITTSVDSQMLGTEWHDGMGVYAGKSQTHLIIYTTSLKSICIPNKYYNIFEPGDSVIIHTSKILEKDIGIYHLLKDQFYYPALGIYSKLSLSILILMTVCLFGPFRQNSNYAAANLFALGLMAFVFTIYVLLYT